MDPSERGDLAETSGAPWRMFNSAGPHDVGLFFQIEVSQIVEDVIESTSAEAQETVVELRERS